MATGLNIYKIFFWFGFVSSYYLFILRALFIYLFIRSFNFFNLISIKVYFIILITGSLFLLNVCLIVCLFNFMLYVILLFWLLAPFIYLLIFFTYALHKFCNYIYIYVYIQWKCELEFSLIFNLPSQTQSQTWIAWKGELVQMKCETATI